MGVCLRGGEDPPCEVCKLSQSKSLGIHAHDKDEEEGKWIFSVAANKAHRWRHVGCCIPAYAQEAETFITAPPQSAWITIILCPQAAPPDSDGLETIPPHRFHSKWEFSSIHHLYCNYFQLSSPFHSLSDRRLQATIRDIFLPVASHFHNMNVVKCMMSKLPLGEVHPIPLFSLAFSSNLHYTWI